jgi:hypothetical protein
MPRALFVAVVAAALLAAPAAAAGPTKTLRPGQTRTYSFGTFVHGGSITCSLGRVRAVVKFPPLPAPNTIRYASAFGIVNGKRVRVSIEIRTRANRAIAAACTR